jgi:transposase
MGKSYRPYYPDEELLLPPGLRDWLPENQLAYFVSDVVDNLDLSAMDAVYGNEKRGQPPYDPLMMTKVLVYGYCAGVFSSRRIEKRLVEDIAFRILAAGKHPNFRTISDFRKIQSADAGGNVRAGTEDCAAGRGGETGAGGARRYKDEGQRQ